MIVRINRRHFVDLVLDPPVRFRRARVARAQKRRLQQECGDDEAKNAVHGAHENSPFMSARREIEQS
jgi:hypothetical protein